VENRTGERLGVTKFWGRRRSSVAGKRGGFWPDRLENIERDRGGNVSWEHGKSLVRESSLVEC